MAKFGQKFIEILIMPKFISAIVDHKKIVFIFNFFFHHKGQKNLVKFAVKLSRVLVPH